IGLTGLPVLETDEMDASNRDSNLAGWLALGGVALLYMVTYRGIRYPLITVVTLVAGTVWSMGWLTLPAGHLTILSSALAVLRLLHRAPGPARPHGSSRHCLRRLGRHHCRRRARPTHSPLTTHHSPLTHLAARVGPPAALGAGRRVGGVGGLCRVRRPRRLRP